MKPEDRPVENTARQQPGPGPTSEAEAASNYSARLREALAEASSTIRAIQEAVVPDQEAEDEDYPPYEELFRACQGGGVRTAAGLLPSLDPNHRASPGVTPLHLAASRGHLEVVRLLLDNGAEPDPRLGLLNSSYGYQLAGATPLILAIANRKTEVARLLLSRGAERTATTDKGFTGQQIIQLLNRLGQSAINLHIA
jgi:uncharacterized protein